MNGVQSRADEVAEKTQRVRAHIAATGATGALFTHQFHVSWITGGAEDVILRGAESGFIWALVTPDGAYILGSNIEASRVSAEEDPGAIGFEVISVPWYKGHFEQAIAGICDPSRLLNDGAGPGSDGADALQALRMRLTAGESVRMRRLGAETCEALEDGMRCFKSGMSGRDLGAELSFRLEQRGIFPFALLVGGDDRRARFRHPTVSWHSMERDALAVVVGVRGGLNIAATRTVSAGEPEPTLAERHAIAAEAEARAIEATRPGATYGEALQAQIDTYQAYGYEDEWCNHTQGGPIGYGAREYGIAPLSHPDIYTRRPIEVGHAVAWNPTVQGAKSEDTFLVGSVENELITNSETWPTITVPIASGTCERPAILQVV